MPVSVHVPQWIVKRGSLTNGVKVTLKGTSQTSIRFMAQNIATAVLLCYNDRVHFNRVKK